MPLPPKLTKFTTTSPVVLSVDFIDQVSGIGYITFYAGDTSDDKQLTTYQYYSHSGATTSANNGALDLDFDVKIEKTLIIDGVCTVYIPWAYASSSQPWTGDSTFTITLRHFDGSTETDLGSATSNKIVTDNTTIGRLDYISALSFNVSRKVFRKGDILRLTIATTAAGGPVRTIIIYDPKGRTTTQSAGRYGLEIEGTPTTLPMASQLTVQVPIVVGE